VPEANQTHLNNESSSAKSESWPLCLAEAVLLFLEGGGSFDATLAPFAIPHDVGGLAGMGAVVSQVTTN
jgi:hypothetical protein